MLKKKLGDLVKVNDVIFEMYAEKNYKLKDAEKLLEELPVYGVGDKYEMQLSKIPDGKKEHKFFLLDR